MEGVGNLISARIPTTYYSFVPPFPRQQLRNGMAHASAYVMPVMLLALATRGGVVELPDDHQLFGWGTVGEWRQALPLIDFLANRLHAAWILAPTQARVHIDHLHVLQGHLYLAQEDQEALWHLMPEEDIVTFEETIQALFYDDALALPQRTAIPHTVPWQNNMCPTCQRVQPELVHASYSCFNCQPHAISRY